MTDYKDTFIEWYNNAFKTSYLYEAMERCVEDSPWHRERNVAVHTDMVVSQFLTRSQPFDIIGALAVAFHDVGKPDALRVKFREDRGEYKAFTGHEQMSARLWEQFAVANWKELSETFTLFPEDIYKVAVMIEHHVPWSVKDKRKLDAIILTMLTISNVDTFENVLISDTFGRISDDAEEKRERSWEWVDKEIISRKGWMWKHGSPSGEKVAFFPVGASGSGKSTFFKSNGFANVETFSLDALRHEWYDAEDYENAFAMSCDDNGFIHKAQKQYQQMMRDGVKEIFVDNTNLTRKIRRFWTTEARNRNYKVVFFLFPSDRQTLVDRQSTREDKSVPASVVLNQYSKIQMPLYYGEADEIIVLDTNLPK